MHFFHPWRQLRERRHVELKWQDSDDELGHFDHDCQALVLTEGMTQAERRSTATHELVHQERGPGVSGHSEAEEKVVDEIAARRLIELPDLINAFLWAGQDEYELADILWVDVQTVRCRLLTLTTGERQHIQSELDRREPQQSA